LPLATQRDQFGRPIYSDARNGRPDDPLSKVNVPSQLTQAMDEVDPERAAIGMPQERQSGIDYGIFGNRQQRIGLQGQAATARTQQAAYEAMQRRLQAAQQNYQGLQQSYRGPVDTTDLRSRLVSTVAGFKGTPYRWGGSSPGGFDCSGLVQYAYARLGIQMPRVSGQQAHQGVRMPINRLQPGDLVAHPGHIAVYAGNGMMWESPHTGAVVRLVPVRSDMYGVHLTLPGDGRG
jgi:cell wall-associated NlpC family hydrolase